MQLLRGWEKRRGGWVVPPPVTEKDKTVSGISLLERGAPLCITEFVKCLVRVEGNRKKTAGKSVVGISGQS